MIRVDTVANMLETQRDLCAANEDSNQPVRPRSVIKVFVVLMKKQNKKQNNFASLAAKKAVSEDSDQCAQMCRLIRIFSRR